MNSDFATAMGRALERTRAGNPAEATRLLQTALAGSGTDAPRASQAWARSSTATKRPAAGLRQPLGRVVAALAKSLGRTASRAQMPAAGSGAVHPEIPQDARYLAQRHATAFGDRDYRLFLPSPREACPQGIVVMLHGCTQSADDFAAGTRMNLQGERHNLIVVYPQQDRAANQMACWNWFRPGDQGRGRGEPALLADLALNLAAEYAVDPARIFAAGLSAGGAMAAILGKTHPDVFAAVGVHSGLAPGAAGDVAGAYAAMRGQGGELPQPCAAPVRTIVFQGTADTVVHPSNAARVIASAVGSASVMTIEDKPAPGPGGRAAACVLHCDAAGRTLAESWTLTGAGHAWSGGASQGSYTYPAGPDASAEMVRFFLNTPPGDRK